MKRILALVLALSLFLGLGSTALADDARTIEFWTIFTGDDGATIQALVDDFNKEYAGKITVNHTAIAADDLYTKLPLTVQTGSGIPDLIIIHVERFPKLVDDGVLTDISPLLDGDVDLANYPAAVLERTHFDSDQYGIPWDFNAPVLYVNMDLVAKHGLEDLLADGYITFDEVKLAGEALKAAGVLDTTRAINYYGGFNEFVARYEEFSGVSLFDADDNMKIDPQIWADMLAGFRELNTLGYAINREDNASTMFIGGNLLFYEAGTWTNATLKTIDGLNYTAMPMPCYSPETALCRSGSHTFAQPDNEDRTEETDLAVAAFVNWMGAHSIKWLADAGQVPLYKAVTEMEEFSSYPQTFLADAMMSDHIKVYNYYYWALFTSAVGHVGMDPIYDASYDLLEAGKLIQKEVDDAIAAMN